MSWAALTLEVNEWADDYPEIVDLVSAGVSEGAPIPKDLWVVRLSDWSNETKPDGSAKEIVYIDGGIMEMNTWELLLLGYQLSGISMDGRKVMKKQLMFYRILKFTF